MKRRLKIGLTRKLQKNLGELWQRSAFKTKIYAATLSHSQ